MEGCGKMRNGNRVRAELGSGVRVEVMARAWVGSRLGFYFASVLCNFSQFMGMVLTLGLGSVVRFRITIKVCLTV